MKVRLAIRPLCTQLERRDAPTVVPVGTEFRVNLVSSSAVDAPSVALDAAGDFVVSWQSYGADGSNNAVLARMYDKAGNSIGNQFQVNTYTTGSQQAPAVARDSAGNFVVAWGSASTQDGSREGIYLRRYNAAGSPLTGEIAVNITTLDVQGNAAIAMDPAGDFVVSWESHNQDGDGYGIYARLFNAAAVPQSGEILVNQTTLGDQRYPAAAMDSAGKFVIAWQGADASGYGVYARRFNAAGAAQDNEFLANVYTTDDQVFPAVASDAAGNFTVAWQSQTQDGGTWGVYARRFDAVGTPRALPFKVNGYTPGDQILPALVSDVTGNLAFTWQSIGEDGAGWGVYGRRYSAGGGFLTAEYRINTITTGDQIHPAIGGDGNGDFTVSWAAENSPLSGVLAQRYARPPVPVATLTVDDGTGQRSAVRNVTLTFNTLVNVAAGGINLTGPNGAVQLTFDSSTSTPSQTILRITFSGAGVTAAGLKDGRYVVTLASNLVTNLDGQGYDGNGDGAPGPDGVFNFFRLYGDVNGNGYVDSTDFLPFRQTFGTSSGQTGFSYYFDWDGDGDVDAADFLAFRSHFGTGLP